MKERPLLSQRRAFSLVEMLVVLTILSILSALTFSSFTLLRTTALTVAGNNIVDVFAMARQSAIADNSFTAVVIRTQGTGALSAYAVFEFPRQADGQFPLDGNSKYDSTKWVQLSPWKYLPKSVVFENNQSIDTYMGTSLTKGSWSGANLPPPLPSGQFSLQGATVDLSTADNVVQCYQPDGTMVSPQALRLRLVEGAADSSGNITYLGATVSGSQVSYYDVYFVANTGLTKIARN